MNYRIGDKVVVNKYPISYNEDHMPNGWVLEMYDYMGRTLTIEDIDDTEPNIYLENGYWYYEYQITSCIKSENEKLIKEMKSIVGDLLQL